MSTASTSLFDAPVARVLPKDRAAVYKTAFTKPSKIWPKGTSLPSANYLHTIADASTVLRNLPDAVTMLTSQDPSVGGFSLMGLTSVLYAGIGLGWAYDAWKMMKACEKNGDEAGKAIARAQLIENLLLSLASVGIGILRGFSIVKDVGLLLKETIIFSAVATTVQTVASGFSAAFFTLYYAIYCGRLCCLLRGLSKGDALRERILGSSNALAEVEAEVQQRMYDEKGSQDYKSIALEEGVLWLERVEKEAKLRGEETPWEANKESRKLHAEMLFLQRPEWMMGEMGQTINWDRYESEGRIIRFGMFVAEKRLRAKVEKDLERALGPDALTALKKNDHDALVKALQSADWSHWGIRWKTTIKIVLAVIGAAALIAGTALTGGIPLGVLLLLFAIGGIVWIVISDGSLFKSQWETGEVRKRDKFLVYFSMALSIVSVIGLIALSVATGGLPLYLASLVLATAWLVVNSRAFYDMVDSQRRPWEYQKIITAEVFARMVKTQPSTQKIQETLSKMSLIDQEGLRKAFQVQSSWEAGAEAWEKDLKKLKERSLHQFMEEMREVSGG